MTEWSTRKEGYTWLSRYLKKTPIVRAKPSIHVRRERMPQRAGLFIADLKEVNLWKDGYIEIHRGTISRRECDEKLTIKLWMNVVGIGEFIFVRDPGANRFTCVTFISDGGSIEDFISERAQKLEDAGHGKAAAWWRKKLEPKPKSENGSKGKKGNQKKLRCGCGALFPSKITWNSHLKRHRGDEMHYRE